MGCCLPGILHCSVLRVGSNWRLLLLVHILIKGRLAKLFILLLGTWRSLLALTKLPATREGEAGLLVRRLDEVVGDEGLQGLVVGRWAEGSQDLHTLMQKLAESRAFHHERTTGVHSTAGSLLVIGPLQTHPKLRLCPAVESCLLDRLGHMVAYARKAAVRRQATVREEEKNRADSARQRPRPL